MSPSSDIVVLAASREELPTWLGTLQDWSALGLVRDFVAIALEDIESSEWRCVLVSGGAASPVVLQQEIASRQGVLSAAVFSLGSIGDRTSLPPMSSSARLREEVHHALPGVPVTWGQLLSVGIAEVWPFAEPSEVAWIGAHNILLAPESSQSPRGGVAAIRARDLRRPAGLTHAAAGAATVAGLWMGQRTGAVRGEPVAGGGQVTLLRSYTRHVAAGGAVSRLLGGVIDVGDRYPVPIDPDGRQLQRASDEVGEAMRLAGSLLEIHAPVLRSSPRAAVEFRAQAVSFRELLRRFFSFMGGVLRGAPLAFAQALETQSVGRLAPVVQRMVLGTGSGHQVTIRNISGVADDGRLVPSLTVEADLDERIAGLSGGTHPTTPPRHDHPELWRDFVHGAMSLLDGHERHDRMSVAVESGVSVVVTNPRAVVPDLESEFVLPPAVRRLVAVNSLRSDDFERISTVDQVLAEHDQGESADAVEVGNVRRRMAEWSDSTRRSYSGRVGAHIATTIADLRAEALHHQRRLAEYSEQGGLPEDVRRQQATLGAITWVMVLVAGLVTGGLILAGRGDLLTWDRVAVRAGLFWAVTIAVLLVVFIRRQRALFQLIHRRDAARHEVESTLHNLSATLADLRRMLAVNRQYLDWNKALAAFVSAPWGDVAEVAGRTAELGPGFPHNHRFGQVLPESSSATELIRELQGRLLPPGWLSEAWEQFIGDLPEFPDRHLVKSDPGLLFSDARMGEKPVLTLWSEAVSRAPRQDVATALRTRLEELVERAPGEVSRKVSWLDGDGQRHETAYEEFAAGVTAEQADNSTAHREFSRRIFVAAPDTVDPWAVGDTQFHDLTASGGPQVLIELTQPIAARDLVFCRRSDASAPSSARSYGAAPQV